MSLAAGPNGCAQALALVDGATYTLVFAAADPAGNTAASPQVTGITYDTTTPMATLVLPAFAGHPLAALQPELDGLIAKLQALRDAQ